MKAESSLTILENFLKEQKIDLKPKKILKDYLVESEDLKSLPVNIVSQIIVDAYDEASEKVKKIDQILVSKHKIHLGRVQKDQLKKCLDYRNDEDVIELVSLTRDETGKFEKAIRKILKSNQVEEKGICDTMKKFHDNLTGAIKKRDEGKKKKDKSDGKKRVRDYLIFIYSRLIAKNEKRDLTLKEIFDTNKHLSKYELSEKQHKALEEFCNSSEKCAREQIIKKYNKKYLDILDNDAKSNEKSSVIYLNITQELFDNYKTKEQFYDAILSFIKIAYKKLKNHKTLAIKVSNIISQNINIKWEIYSYVSIFGEKFIKKEEKHQYFQPHELCKNYLEYRHGLKLEKKTLEEYFDGEKDYPNFLKKNKAKFSKEDIDELKFVYSGFTFIDCSILLSKNKFKNSKEVDFIENKNELLLLFFKHEIDSRKIPCPVCGSLIISGNSFPELGIRSWECKNPVCSQRSKTNRGKRYSARTIFMQDSTFDFREQNTISSDLITKWRKDVVEDYTLESLYSMLTKYFSQIDDSLTIIGAQNPKKFEKIIKNQARKHRITSFQEFVGESEDNLYNEFFEVRKKTFLDCFLYDGKLPAVKKATVLNSGQVIHGNCIKELQKLENVHNMVTSPPYYNAREYKQWLNLYDYLHDMYLVALGSFRALQKGGVFFFNIGDIFDNEKITVTSKMGEKRIPLGAYIILIFQKAGFELLDDVIWNKGEPQSNRHKNDGNNVPYYQRPTNCYEHMFIFKKPGATLKLNKNKKQLIITNHQEFLPVFKTFKKGSTPNGKPVNIYGHTAPFPENIPRMSLHCFTNEGDIILDPFAGSGTTIFTAIKEKRCGIGIELKEEYVKLSKKKIKEKGI